MAKKGIDTVFVHYGIRREDMAVIEQLCEKHQLDQEWVKEELLKEFHEIKETISGLQKGELIIKNPTAITLGMGKKYKKIRVRHLI